MASSLLTEALETLSGSVNYQAWIYGHLRADLGRNVLDIGSGFGDLPRLFGADSRRTVIVSDADDALVAQLRRRYAGCAGYRVVRLCIVEGHAPGLLPPEPVDTITCVNVLEHIRCDRTALLNMHRILAQHGKLLLFVPALPCLLGTVDRAVGHYRRYTKQGLNKKLRQAGFTVEKQQYMNFFGLLTWWLGSAVLQQRMFQARACRPLDRLVPWVERLERLWTPPVGQSLVTVCRKAGDSDSSHHPEVESSSRRGPADPGGPRTHAVGSWVMLASTPRSRRGSAEGVGTSGIPRVRGLPRFGGVEITLTHYKESALG